MTNKDIEKAIRGFIEAGENNAGWCEHESGLYHDGFVDGANWRINSVWHDVSERPNGNEPTIIERTGNKFSFHEKGYDGPWKYNVEQFGFKRWAYIKDLIPNIEDDI